MRSDNSRIRIRQVAGLAAIAGILLLNPASAETLGRRPSCLSSLLGFRQSRERWQGHSELDAGREQFLDLRRRSQ